MKIVLKSKIQRNSLSTITFFFDSETKTVSVEAVYYENDVPQTVLTGYLRSEQILDLIGSIESIIFDKDKSFVIKIETDDDSTIIISLIKHMVDQNLYLLKVEDLTNQSFVQYQETARRFLSLNVFLKAVFSLLVQEQSPIIVS